MNFQITVNVNTNILTIEKMLHNKHGRIKDLTLYKDAIVKEENEMCGGAGGANISTRNGKPSARHNNQMKTLKEYGIVGGLIKDDAPICSICYDFKPINDCHDPVLLSWMG